MATQDQVHEMWTCVWNVFTPFWSISQASSESGLAGHSALEVYVERPDMRAWRKLSLAMQPGRTVTRAVVVGQRGAGKSMDLAWLAHQLSKTHVVFWVDAVGQTSEILQDPLRLFIAIASAVYEGVQQIEGVPKPDRKRFEAFLSACLDTDVQESADEQGVALDFGKALGKLTDTVSQVMLPASLRTGNPIFMEAGEVTGALSLLLDWVDLGGEHKVPRVRSRTTPPQVDRAAARLSAFVADVSRRCERPMVVLVDGLDRVETPELEALFHRARDLARPALNLILTAPLVLYNTLTFDQLQDFFPEVLLSSNINVAAEQDVGETFLQNVVRRRLACCGKTLEDVFAAGALSQLIRASGGNVRQLLCLIREASLEAQLEGKIKIDHAASEAGINTVRNDLLSRLRAEARRALRDFYQQPPPRLPLAGEIGDNLVRAKYILAYGSETGLQYVLNPLIKTYVVGEVRDGAGSEYRLDSDMECV